MVSLSRRLKYVLRDAKSRVIKRLFNTNPAGIKYWRSVDFFFFYMCFYTQIVIHRTV